MYYKYVSLFKTQATVDRVRVQLFNSPILADNDSWLMTWLRRLSWEERI
jgi:hypothetical protein